MVLSLIALPIKAQTCYYPNGDIALDDIPCNATTSESTCCGPTYACLSNNICMETSLTPGSSGSTTYIPARDDTAGGEGIAKCPDTKFDLYYCIDGAPSNCSVYENILSFTGKRFSSAFLNIFSDTHHVLWYYTGSPTIVRNPAASSTSSRTSLSTTMIISDTSTLLPSSSTTALAATTSMSSASTKDTMSTAVGAGIGVPLGLIALATIVYLTLRYKGKRYPAATTTSERNEQMSWSANEHCSDLGHKGVYDSYPFKDVAPFEMDSQPQTHELAASTWIK
nr:hypothetical protein CFP56_54429 [Quercus suber]